MPENKVRKYFRLIEAWAWCPICDDMIALNIDKKEIIDGLQSLNALPHSATFISLSSPDNANMAIGVLDAALKKVNKQRADLGAYQNRLDYASHGLLIGAENLQGSESLVRDVDMAEKMVDFVKNQILVQSSTAMLAQANTKPQTVLQLLQ